MSVSVLCWILAIVICLFVWRSLILTPKVTFEDFAAEQETGVLTAFASGLMGDGVTQSDPIRPTWRKFADVLCVRYGYTRFTPRDVARHTANAIMTQGGYDALVLRGSSMGMLVMISVWKRLRRLPSDRRPAKTTAMIIDDGVCGPLYMIPPIVALLLRFLPFGPITNRAFGWAVPFVFPPPKDAEIEDGPEGYAAWVKQEAKRAIGRHAWSQFRDQAAYIAWHRPLSPKMFKGLEWVEYRMCTTGNATVKQPGQMLKVKAACEKAGVPFKVVEIPHPHCSYLQQSRVWSEIDEDTFSRHFAAK